MKWSVIILLFLSFGWFFRIANINERLEGAYEAYFKNDNIQAFDHLEYLTDSLTFQEDGLELNKAHTQFKLGSAMLLQGGQTTDDSTTTITMGSALELYNSLWVSDDKQLKSIAYNQAGVITFKTKSINGEGAVDEEILATAIDYFKMALIEDPENEDARYNYEILKKYTEYPEKLMEVARKLVRQRHYAEAYGLLANKVQSDPRFVKHQEFFKRLTDIIKIEKEAP